MKPLRRALMIALLALLHLAASAAGMIAVFGATMQRFDTGSPPALTEVLLDRALTLLYFPLVHLGMLAPREWFAGPIGWLPFALNSLLWGCAIVWAGQWWRERQAALATADLAPLPPDPNA